MNLLFTFEELLGFNNHESAIVFSFFLSNKNSQRGGGGGGVEDSVYGKLTLN